MATPNTTMDPGAPGLPPGLTPPPVPALDNTYGVLMLGTSLGLMWAPSVFSEWRSIADRAVQLVRSYYASRVPLRSPAGAQAGFPLH